MSLSRPLNCLITLDMKEKHEGCATLQDVTAATFDRFLEWATKGFYTPPLPFEAPQPEDGWSSGDSPEEIHADGAAAEPPNEASIREENAAEELEVSDDPWGDGSPENEVILEDYEEPEPEPAPKLQPNSREAFYCRVPSVRRTAIYTPPPRKNLHAGAKFTGYGHHGLPRS